MQKTVYIAAALVCMIAFTVRGTMGTQSATTSSPVIVAKGSFLNQNAPIPPTTIYTPTVTGLYRVAAYAVITKNDLTGGSLWTYSLNWTDAGGPESTFPGLYRDGKHRGGFLNDISIQAGGPSTVIEAGAGFPIQVSMIQGGTADSAEYSLFYAVEQLR